MRRPLGLGTQILLGMVAGTVLGLALGERAAVLSPVGDLFIRLLVLAAVPLVFFNLLAGTTALTDLRTLGRLAGKILAYFMATTVVATALGIGVMVAFRPGVGMTLRSEVGAEVGRAPSVMQVFTDLIPTNAVGAFVGGNVTQVVVLAVMLGVATLLLPEAPRDRLRVAYADLAELLRKVVDLILKVAPYGVGALMMVTIGRYGAELLGPMAWFVLGITAAHLVILSAYMALLRLFSSWRPLSFLKETWTIWATTLATTSSLASVPVSLGTAERLKLPRTLYSFSIPLGAQINKDGTAATLSAVVVFTAQAVGVSLGLGDFVTIVLMGTLLSAGSGGIPGGGFVVALVMVEAFHFPLELAAVVGGIYRLVDMGNTTLNIMGDWVGTILVAESEARRPGAAAAASD